METKYYTPSLEEFHVGFECEMRNSSDDNAFDWEFCKFENDFSNQLNEDYCFEYLEADLKLKYIRVKYLDNIDLIGFGWKDAHMDNAFYLDTKLNSYHLYFLEENEIHIWKGAIFSPILYKFPIFKGIIKNKCEFKKLMQQLNIQ